MDKKDNFKFKQFSILQEKSAMKVGIDGVLLGAWANVSSSECILDVGTGTGLLSLMAAQRSGATIDAVEIDEDAFHEASFNFMKSKWESRLHCFHGSFQEFETRRQYDHIISNPPFFEKSLKSDDKKKNLARHTDTLTLSVLLGKSKSLLSKEGKISLILPADQETKIEDCAKERGLYVTRKCFVHPFPESTANRIIVELGLFEKKISIENISVRNKSTNSYSEEFRELTRDFYVSI